MNVVQSLDSFVDRPPQRHFLRSKFQVGSCKSDRKTFPPSQKVFHSGDVPPNVLAAKKEVLKSVKPDTLCLERLPWDINTIADPKLREQKDKRKNLKAELLLVRAGLMDEMTMPKTRADEKTEAKVSDYVR